MVSKNAKKPAKKRASVDVDVFEGFVRHTCGWINVKGRAFVVGAGCPKCGERITAVEKLSDDEVKKLRLKKLSGVALDRAARQQKERLQEPEPEELEHDEGEDGDEDEGDDDSDDDDGDEGDDDSDE